MDRTKLNLNTHDKKLLGELVDSEFDQRFSLKDMTPKKKEKSIEKINDLSSKMKSSGIKIHNDPHTEEYWVDHSDIKANEELQPILSKSKEDTTLLYLSPGEYGLGTLMFDPLLAQGLNLYLNNNTASFNGKTVSDKPLINSLDGIVINGGYFPELPKQRTSSKTDAKKLRMLNQLDDSEMSNERYQKEKDILEQMEKNGASAQEIEKHKNTLYGKIETPQEAATNINSMLKNMLGDYQGKIYVKIGNEFQNNVNVVKKSLEEDIKENLKEINAYRREINSFSNKIEDVGLKKIIASNIIDQIDEMYEQIEVNIQDNYELIKDKYAIMDDEELSQREKQKKEKILESKDAMDWIEQDAREAERRKLFTDGLESYLSSKVPELESGIIEWNESYFDGLSEEKINDYVESYNTKLCQNTISAMEIVRTLYGLGWQSKKNKKRKADAVDGLNDIKVGIKNAQENIEDVNDILSALGWYDDKPISQSSVLEHLRLEDRAKDELLDLYYKAGEGFDIEILPNEYSSSLRINGHSFRILTQDNISQGLGTVKNIRTDVLKRVKDLKPVPEITLTGPGDAFVMEGMRDTYANYRDGPKLKYQDQANPAIIIQTPHMYTSDNIEFMQKDHKSYSDYEAGHVIVHFLSNSGSEGHIDSINVDDLKAIALKKESIDNLVENEEVKGASKKRLIRDLNSDAKYETVASLINLGDLHFGDRNSIHQNTSEMRRDTTIEYMVENYGPADLLVIGEAFDGYQYIKGIDLAQQSKAMTEIMHKKAIDNILNDKSLSSNQREAYLTELGRMQTDGFAKTPMEDQYELLPHSSTGQYIVDCIKNNGDVVLIDGDHPSRTTKGKSSESRAIRNMYVLKEVELEDGRTISAAEKMIVGDGSQLTNVVRYDGSTSDNPNLDGIDVYTTHKGGTNEIKNPEKTGGPFRVVLTQHNHHFRAQTKGQKASYVSAGFVQPYDIVDEKGLSSNIQGVARILLPDMNNSMYKSSTSMDYAFESAIHSDKFKERAQIRKDLCEKYIPHR